MPTRSSEGDFCKEKALFLHDALKGGDAMDEGRFDDEGYYRAVVNGKEIVFESWQAYRDYISDTDD